MQKSQEPYWELKSYSIIWDWTLTSLTSNAGEDSFIWTPQWAEDEHTVLENARGTLGSLASVLIFLPKVSSEQQLGTTTLTQMKSPFTVVKGEDNH